jgi:peroxiredoxin
VLDRLRAHFEKLAGVEFQTSTRWKMSIDGHEEVSEFASSLKAARPNLALLEHKGAGFGMTAACDGQTLTNYVGLMNKYESTEAPATLADVLRRGQLGDMGGEDDLESTLTSAEGFILALMEPAQSKRLFDAVDKVELVGREKDNDVEYDRLRISGDGAAADVWIRAEGDPWVDRIVPDMAKAFEGMNDIPDALKTQVPSVEMRLTAWKVLTDAAPEQFKYTPPEGAEKVDDLQKAMMDQFGGGPEEQPDHDELLGTPAPDVALELLDGGKMSLADHRGKDVVVLDFWATWCPPCIRGLPIVAKVCAEFRDKHVVFYAVNQQEQSEDVREFLKTNNLNIKVPMDAEGDAAQAYGVTGIPQTVLIGRDGTVQALHVGFTPGIEAELRDQLKTLAEGKPLAEPGKQAATPAPEDTLSVEELWSEKGSWTTAATDPTTGGIYALDRRGNLVQFSRDGERIATIKLKRPDNYSVMRLANLVGTPEPEFVLFQPWLGPVQAFGRDGEPLWSYPAHQGVDDVGIADLDGNAGDRLQEVIIGYNGSTGLHAVNADGTNRWKHDDVGNVWHVTTGFPDANGVPRVITTSAAGALHFFSAAGKQVDQKTAFGYANLVRLATIKPDADPVLVVGVDNGDGLVCVDRDGKKIWRTKLGARSSHAIDGVGAPNHPWFAVAFASGEVVVFDVTTGARLASARREPTPSIGWLAAADGQPPVLVIAGGDAIAAYKLQKKAP